MSAALIPRLTLPGASVFCPALPRLAPALDTFDFSFAIVLARLSGISAC
jgi:hypothetical protein